MCESRSRAIVILGARNGVDVGVSPLAISKVVPTEETFLTQPAVFKRTLFSNILHFRASPAGAYFEGV